MIAPPPPRLCPLFLIRILILTLSLAFSPSARAQTSAVFPVEEHGARSRRVNLVFLSEGYTTADMPKFATDVQTAVNFLFSKEPWKQYRLYCNVYRIEIASAQSGCDNGSTSGSGGTRNTYFNSGFNTPSVVQLLTLDSTGDNRAYALLNKHVPEYDVSVVIVNDSKYGGAGGTVAVASVNSLSAAIVEHEIGHSFALLTDEYDTEYTVYTPSEQPNTTAITDRARIRWKQWIETATPVPTPETSTYDSAVGLFEGSMYRTKGWYRPHNNSLMRNLNRPCGQVNREQFVLQYYSRVSPVDSWLPTALNRSVPDYGDLSFSVSPMMPSGASALSVAWKVDGIARPDLTGTGMTINSETLGNGAHTVAATVSDPTPFVRLDPSNLLNDTITWSLNLTNQLPPDLPAWRAKYGPDTASPQGDGLPNLVKYALGLDPSKSARPDQQPTPARTTVSSGGGGGSPHDYLTLRIPRRSLRANVEYHVDFSSDLSTWTTSTTQSVIVSNEDQLLVVRDLQPLDAGSRRFARLRVVAP